MRIAFSKPTRDDAELERLVTTYRTAGYEGLQLKMGQFLPYLGRADDFRRDRGDDPGTVSGLIVFDTLDDAGRDRLDAVVRFAGDVGSERIVFCHNHGHDGVTAADRREFARRLAESSSKAADTGVRLSLHHHYDQPVMLPEDVHEFFDAVPAGTLGLTVDTAHLAKSGVQDIPGFLAEFAPVVDNIHLKDIEGDRWRILGEGELDLDAVLTQLHHQGFAGWLCVDEESDASLDHALTASRQWLDAHL